MSLEQIWWLSVFVKDNTMSGWMLFALVILIADAIVLPLIWWFSGFDE